MEIKMVKLSEIKMYERNAKKHPPEQVEKIAKSIKEFGFNQPIVLDKNNVLIVGHGRILAAMQISMTEVPAILKDNLTPEQVNAYRLADNKLNESDWDMSLVLDELNQLSLEMVELTGFDMTEFKPAELDEQGKLDETDSKEISCPECGHNFVP